MASSPDHPWLRHYEAGVPAEVEIPELTVDGLLRRAAERFPDRDAMIFYGARTSFRLLDQAVDRFAGYLGAIGLVPGDRVSLHLPTSPAFVIAFLGTLRAGCISVPMSPLLVEREVEVLFRQTRPRLSVAMDILVPRVAGARTALGDLLAPPSGGEAASGILATGIKDSLPIPIRWLYPFKMRREHRWHPVAHSTSMPNFFRALRAQPPIRVESVAHHTDPAVLQPTGGTTGTPKAATLTHRNLVANAVQCTSTLVKDDDGQPASIMCALPYFHIYGLTVALDFALQLGFTQILLPRFVVPETLEAIRRHRPRLFPGAPSFYASLLNDPHLGRYDLSSLEACISGSAPLPWAVQERFEALSHGRVSEGYGLTEAAPVTHVNPVHGEHRPGTVGLPLPSTDAQVRDVETGRRTLLPGEIGELWVRGPQVMAGYWERPAETAAVLRDGWLRTGDLASMDQDGYFRIVDRLKDLIIVSGANVFPREVDEVLIGHPDVLEAATIGVPDPVKGEVVKSYVVLREGAITTPSDLITYCRANLSRYKTPTVIEIRDGLPRTGLGKLLRRNLREEDAASNPAAGVDVGARGGGS
jgi:long-chain acyl-CoA synthetase